MTTTINNFKADICYTALNLTVQVPTKERGVRSLILDRSKIKECQEITSEENLLLLQIIDEGLPGHQFSMSLSVDELKMLASVGKKIGALLGQVTAPTATADKSNQRVVINTEHRTSGAGIDAAEQRISQLKNVVKKIDNNTYHQFEYDIPEASEQNNPSALLWRFAIRMTKSCWIMPESSLNHPKIQALLQRYAETGVTVHLIEYAESQKRKIKAIAEEKLCVEIRRQHTKLIKDIDAANERLKSAVAELEKAEEEGKEVSSNEQEAPVKKRDQDMRNAINKAAKALDASIECAQLFDETEQTAHLLQGLREATRSAALAFNAEMRMKRGTQVNIPPAE